MRPTRACACGCPASMAAKRPQAHYATDRCRKRDHMRRSRGARAGLAIVPCAGCGEPVMVDGTKGHRGGRAYHPSCGDAVRPIRKNRHKRTPDLARSMGWVMPVDDE